MKFYYTFLARITLMIFMVSAASAQTDSSIVEVFPGTESGVTAICKKSGKDIIIRWAPEDAGLWLKSLQGVVNIERTVFSSFGERSDTSGIVLIDTLRPWSVERLKNAMVSHPHKDVYGMVGSILYGEWQSIDTTREDINIGDITNRYDELVNRYSNAMLLADLDGEGAEAMGLRYVDSDVPDANYISYRIILILPDGSYYQASTLYNKAMNITAIPRIEDWEELDGQVRISWERTGHEKYFSAYFIERSRDGINYSRINELPYINALDAKESFGITPISFTAKAENGLPYHYRIVGLDPFGEVSLPSEPILLTARDLTPPPAPIHIEVNHQDDNTMHISWEQDSIAKDLLGFLVLKGTSFDGSFMRISDTLSANARFFTDGENLIYGATYYRVCALDRSGNRACTQPVFGVMVDSIPPSRPEGLTGEIDSLGIVSLSWNANTEEDLDGYFVYYSNGPDNVFQRLNAKPTSFTKWVDTVSLGTLTEEIYYKVTAVDLRSNVSDFTEAVMVSKPDTIPPTVALLKSYSIDEDGIEIIWINSNSRDVVRHELSRKSESEEWRIIGSFIGLEDRYVDKDVKAGIEYEYDISAIDDAGLRSKQTNTFKLVYPHTIKKMDLQLELSQGENAIRVKLMIPEASQRIRHASIYRKENDGVYRKLSILPFMDPLEILDHKVENNNKYTYKYKLFFDNGLQSNYSNEFALVFEPDKN